MANAAESLGPQSPLLVGQKAIARYLGQAVIGSILTTDAVNILEGLGLPVFYGVRWALRGNVQTMMAYAEDLDRWLEDNPVVVNSLRPRRPRTR